MAIIFEIYVVIISGSVIPNKRKHFSQNTLHLWVQDEMLLLSAGLDKNGSPFAIKHLTDVSLASHFLHLYIPYAFD